MAKITCLAGREAGREEVRFKFVDTPGHLRIYGGEVGASLTWSTASSPGSMLRRPDAADQFQVLGKR